MSLKFLSPFYRGLCICWFLVSGTIAAGGSLAFSEPVAGTNDPAKFLAEASNRTDAALARADLTAYRGWLKFLRFEAVSAAKRSGVASDTAVPQARLLDEWVRRITANPGLLATLGGVQEWAYESPVDGSGQPFKIAIPTEYDPSRPAPLNVYMHGSGGNHLEHATAMVSHPNLFEISVLGRARDGGYRALSEADVLQAIDYVEAHWAIDLDRVRIRGGSMGGGGTYRLGARYPHRWASGRPSCGFASFVPIGNLASLPIYATHSADDWAVSILHERGPLARLRELGGQVIFDETDGYGHAVWNYKEGNERGTAWVSTKVRPDSRTVRHIDYTALDGAATRAWWAEISEWGGAPANARFVLSAGDSNSLFAELKNITRLSLSLAESPFDRALPLDVSVNGSVPIRLPAPLPASVVLAHGAKGWEFEIESEPLNLRLHTPGSASLLYNGDPLLIVYGTGGNDAERMAMRSAAEAASKSPNPAWPDDSGEAGPDGVPNSQNLYGRLNAKADADVTDSDLKRCHLVLIGTAAQNSLVARIANFLPVRFTDGEITCSDGVKFTGAKLALGLVYYNPLAPGKLVYWVASDNPAVYAAGSLIPFTMSGGRFFGANSFGADLLVMPATAMTFVAARSFDSRWHWVPGRESSPLLEPSFRTTIGLSNGVGAAIRRATGADYAMVGKYGSPIDPPVAIGVTRVSDLAPLFANIPIGVFEISGTELVKMARLASAEDSGLLIPDFDEKKIDAAHIYCVALPVNLLWTFSTVLKTAPSVYRCADLDTRDAVERFLASR
jgi:hypothetical protein